MFGPTITGEKCVLASFDSSEIERIWRLLQDPEVIRYLKMEMPPSLESEKAWYQKVVDSDDAIYWGIWIPERNIAATAEKSEMTTLLYPGEEPMELVGTCSLENINFHHQRATSGTLLFDKTAWGQGISTEMMKLRLDWAFTALPLRKICSGYLADNTASAKMQERAGYQVAGIQREHFWRDGKWQDHVTTEIMRDKWSPSQR